MKKVELYLKLIKGRPEDFRSVDIYYDDLAGEFVVRVKDNVSDKIEHFRNAKLKTSLIEAAAWAGEPND